MKFFLMLSIFLVSACVKKDGTPEAALKDFVESRVGQVIDRGFVLDRVTGKMLQSFENMSDEDFSKFADMRNIKTESFKILSKSCQENRCYVTYAISYLTKKDNQTQTASEVKKIAEMVFLDNRWLIGDVSNIKTYHENMEPINP
jgi:hypothetical protein